MIAQLPERFWTKIKTEVGGCWEWTSSRSAKGYGTFFLDGRARFAHRLMYQFYYKQDVSRDAMILHSCDRPWCVNPRHLSVGNQTENMRQRNERKRQAHLRGEQHGMHRLTWEQVCEIRQASGSSAKVAEAFGVCKSTVKNIRSGKSWKHSGRDS